jgi:NADH-quinone oxidoreductase subunit M
MDRREKAILFPLVVTTLWLGIYPSVITDITRAPFEAMITDYRAALPQGGDTQLAEQ